ncbi:MAG: TonB-dependent receptor, partial [Gimesia chilikensis]
FTLFENISSTMELTLFGDYVRAKFDAGGNVPRIPAAKLGAELRLFGDLWSMHLHVTDVGKQDDVGQLELPTGGYTLLSFYADYHWPVATDSELRVYLKADNLLDETVRNHASFLKNFSPEPGRSLQLGVRFEY